jgi:ABC-type Fe3+/spermidine/putrescine transport system ATPase subunit
MQVARHIERQDLSVSSTTPSARAGDGVGTALKSSLVQLRQVSRVYGDVVAVHPMDLEIAAGDFLAILGPSGCGKTTLLRMLGGFIKPSSGTVHIAGEDVTALAPERRSTNMVFQSYGLFPHMNVRQNVAYGLAIAGIPRPEIQKRVDEILALVRLESLADARVTEMSGGQQQRVALARALIMRPKVLLLDEPLAALDLKLRKAMHTELRALHKAVGGTFVFVTHDQGEAMALANRIVVMDKGRVAQEGTAEDIYLRPSSHFVSTFVGEANFIAGSRKNDQVEFGGGRFAAAGPDGTVTVGIRPECVLLGVQEGATDFHFSGVIREKLFLGPFVQYVIEIPGDRITAHGRALRLGEGDTVSLGWSRADQWVVALNG